MSRATDLEILEVADRDDRDRRPSIAEPRIGAAAELSSLHRSRVG